MVEHRVDSLPIFRQRFTEWMSDTITSRAIRTATFFFSSLFYSNRVRYNQIIESNNLKLNICILWITKKKQYLQMANEKMNSNHDTVSIPCSKKSYEPS